MWKCNFFTKLGIKCRLLFLSGCLPVCQNISLKFIESQHKVQKMMMKDSLIGPEDFVRDLTEEDLLIWLQVCRRSLSDEGFSVEQRHLRSAPGTQKGGNPGHKVRQPTANSGQTPSEEREQRSRGAGLWSLLDSLIICPHGAAPRTLECFLKLFPRENRQRIK